jgi:flagellin-like protein
MRKIFRNRKALSPVVASIILIAVTVAVSIAVAAWMGALTIGFMGTEQLTISELHWNEGNFTMTVNNVGTKDVVITSIEVNYAKVSNIVGIPSGGLPLKAGENETLTVIYQYTNGAAYDISVVTSSGYKFTDHFIGGQNKT